MTPPLGSIFNPASNNEFSTYSTSAVGKSILLIATIACIF